MGLKHRKQLCKPHISIRTFPIFVTLWLISAACKKHQSLAWGGPPCAQLIWPWAGGPLETAMSTRREGHAKGHWWNSTHLGQTWCWVFIAWSNPAYTLVRSRGSRRSLNGWLIVGFSGLWGFSTSQNLSLTSALLAPAHVCDGCDRLTGFHEAAPSRSYG